MQTRRDRSVRPAAWLLPSVGGLALALAAVVLLLGLTWPFVAGLMLLFAGVALWAVSRLRAERVEHRAALAKRDADKAALAERLRLARDLHDIVSHGLGMITVRTAAAAHLHARAPDDQALLAALGDVEEISRTATVELRRMLAALRDAAEGPARQPTDSLAALPGIVDGARRGGLRVESHQEDLGPVSPGAQATICRVVREGLANTARHAGATRVDVRLARTADAVLVTVEDDGPQDGWAARPGTGLGLVGLREILSSLGGALAAGPRPQVGEGKEGFRLEATIPEAAG